MKKKILSIVCLIILLSSALARISHGYPAQSYKKISQSKPESVKPPMIDPVKMKESRESCIKENQLPILKKGEKPSAEQIKKFSNCMHEKLAAEVERVRQQKR